MFEFDNYAVHNDMRRADAMYHNFSDWLDTCTDVAYYDRITELKLLLQQKYATIQMFYDDIQELITKYEIGYE